MAVRADEMNLTCNQLFRSDFHVPPVEIRVKLKKIIDFHIWKWLILAHTCTKQSVWKRMVGRIDKCDYEIRCS